MLQLVLIEILAVPAEQSRGRHNPRVVKRKMSSFPTKARAAPGAHQVICYRDHIHIVAPAADPAVQTCPQPKPPPQPPMSPSRQASWRDHVRAWRESGLKRAIYAQRHGLKLRTLNQWIARLRHTVHRRQAAPGHA
jgi:hypothetical protein